MKSEHNASTILRLLSIALLFLALGNHPYSFYTILRWVVSASSLYTGWILSKFQNHNWAWIFFIIGILFNPIFPVYLDKVTWQLIDLAVAITIIISMTKKNKNVV